MRPTYTVRRPSNARPDLRADAVVTRHRTLDAATRSLARQQRGARQQGGYSRDYIVDEEAQAIVESE